VNTYRDAKDIGPVDLVIVTWKATANHMLAEVLPSLMHKHTQVLTLQNGLGNCEAIAAIVGADRVMGGLCFVCINRIQPGLIRHSAGGKVSIGAFSDDPEGRAEEITRRFQAAAIRAHAVDNLMQSQWEKLIWNIPFNGLSVAEGGVTTDTLLANPDTESEIRALMLEVISTANAIGLPLSEDLAEANIERTRPMGPYRTSSMIDFIEGREVEVGPIWEEPLKRAQASGLKMPHLEKLLERIRQRLKSI
jgi:2-dehydropantoate 2-reductase